jgi:hypothetical protein
MVDLWSKCPIQKLCQLFKSTFLQISYFLEVPRYFSWNYVYFYVDGKCLKLEILLFLHGLNLLTRTNPRDRGFPPISSLLAHARRHLWSGFPLMRRPVALAPTSKRCPPVRLLPGAILSLRVQPFGRLMPLLACDTAPPLRHHCSAVRPEPSTRR